MKVELVAITTGVGKYSKLNQEEITSAIARHGIIKEDNGKLVKYLMAEKHFSPLDMVNFVFEIQTSRAIGRQILRHASIKFQEHCITGDSLITMVSNSGRTSKVKIEDLYKRYNNSYWKRSDNSVRVYDSLNKYFSKSEIKEVFCNGENDIYRVKLSNGKEIKTTMAHKFFKYKEGFVRLNNLSVGDFLGTNGVALHQNKEWMESAKIESFNHGGLKYISEKADVSYHTIRKWLKKHNIQYTKKEVASYTTIWNKGLPKENQPMFNKIVSEETRLKLRNSVRKKSLENINKRKGNRSFELRCRDFSYKYKRHLHIIQNGKCALTGMSLNSEYQIDHIKPIKLYPDLAFKLSNLQAVNIDAHNFKTISESKKIRKTIRYSQIESIEYVGKEMTYDLEINHSDHNYIANGILVHNSQRYSESAIFEPIELRKEHPTNRQSSTDVFDPELSKDEDGNVLMSGNELVNEALEYIEDVYNSLLKSGVAKECARMILPECTTTTMTANGTLRSWLSFLNVRQDFHSQKEVQEISTLIGEALESAMPNVFKQIDWRKGMFM